MAAPRGISQPPTSFIGSQCQGIHHAPLNTYNTKPKNESKKEIAYKQMTNPHQQHPPPTKRGEPIRASRHLDARNHYPQIKHHTPPPKQGSNKTPEPTLESRHPPQRSEPAGLLPQDPTVCLAILRINRFPSGQHMSVVHQTRPHYRDRPSSRIARLTEPPHDVGGAKSRGAP